MEGKVYISASSMITSLGEGVSRNMEMLLAGKTGVHMTEDSRVTDSSVMAGIIPEEIYGELYGKYDAARTLTRTELLAVACMDGLGKIHLSGGRTALVIASAKGNVACLEGQCGSGPAVPPDGSPVLMGNMAERIGSRFGFSMDDTFIVSNACISGVSALVIARRLILSGRYKQAVVVGVDTQNRFITSGFASFKSLSPELCRPYDESRCGLNLGEACGAVLLSGDPSGAAVSIDGGAATDDANHISGPSRTGDGLFYAIRRALGEAGLTPGDVDMLQMHGTATAYNDEMESKAAALSGLQNVPLQSLKAYFGHTMGASGVIETIIAAEEIRTGVMVGTLGFSRTGVPVPVNVVPETVRMRIRHCVKTASGFGGTNAALLLSEVNASVPSPCHADVPVMKTVRRVEIADCKVNVDGNVVFECPGEDFPAFIREAYKSRGESGMKFYKMDDVCKLGYMASEWLLDGIVYGEEECGIVLSGKYGCLDTDMKHQNLIDGGGDAAASPAVFVYTLPNVAAGEISIRHHIKNENTWLWSDDKAMCKVRSYANLAASAAGMEYCIIGWLDCIAGVYRASFELLSRD